MIFVVGVRRGRRAGVGVGSVRVVGWLVGWDMLRSLLFFGFVDW